MQSPPFPRYLIPPRSKYSPQHHVLKHPQLPFLPQCQQPSFTPIQNNRQNYSSRYGLSTLEKKNTSTPPRPLSIPHPSGYSNYCPISSRLLQLGPYVLSHQRTIICTWSSADKCNLNRITITLTLFTKITSTFIFLRCPVYKKKK